jgi:hypothetical protein
MGRRLLIVMSFLLLQAGSGALGQDQNAPGKGPPDSAAGQLPQIASSEGVDNGSDPTRRPNAAPI